MSRNSLPIHLSTFAIIFFASVECVENFTDIVFDNGTSQNTPRIIENELQLSIIEKLVEFYTFTNASNDLCREQSLAYQRALITYEPWAMKMLDSSSKLQAGLATGNFYEHGAFTQCINIEVDEEVVGKIMGKHCTISVELPEAVIRKLLEYRDVGDVWYQLVRLVYVNSTITWSVCIPSACDSYDVQQHFSKKIFEIVEGLDIKLNEPISCATLSDSTAPYSDNEKIVITLLISIVVVAVISTLIDVYKSYNHIGEPGFEIIFSMVANTRYITAKKKSHDKMACLHGIRTLSMFCVIIGHRYLMAIFYPSVNAFEFIDFLDTYVGQLIVGATVSVDSFLLMSALLVSYNVILSLEQGKKFNYFAYLLHRYLRLTPSYAFVILIIAVCSHRFGTGPYWKETSSAVQTPCQDYWWSALLYMQPYVNYDKLCILQSWYLSIDTFYYVFAPALIIPLFRNKHIGILGVWAVYFLSVATNFSYAYTNKYSVTVMLDNQLATSKYFGLHYTQPHIRASPYILGILFGYALYKMRNRKFYMGPWTVFFGWLLSLGGIVVIVLINKMFLNKQYVYEPYGASIFIAIHRSAWAIALSWIIWACVHGYGGPINTFLSSHFFSVFAKLTYSAFLVHMQFQYLDNGSNKLPNYFSNIETVRKGFGDIGIAYLTGYFLTIMVECPVYRISLMLFKGRRKVDNTSMT